MSFFAWLTTNLHKETTNKRQQRPFLQRMCTRMYATVGWGGQQGGVHHGHRARGNRQHEHRSSREPYKSTQSQHQQREGNQATRVHPSCLLLTVPRGMSTYLSVHGLVWCGHPCEPMRQHRDTRYRRYRGTRMGSGRGEGVGVRFDSRGRVQQGAPSS